MIKLHVYNGKGYISFMSDCIGYIHRTEVISSHQIIFAPVQRVKIALTKFKFYKKVQGFVETLQLCHFKMTGRPCTDEVPVKVPSFQKVTLFSVINYSSGTLSIYILISLKMFITAMI